MGKILLSRFHQQKKKNIVFKSNIMLFKTNAPNFKIYYTVKNKYDGNYPHFGVTAREGIHILYRYPNTKNWFNVDAFSSKNSPIHVNMKYIIRNNEEYEILIYKPKLSEITQLKIEPPENYTIKYLESEKDKTILVAGGIHSFGIGCTASGVMFPNILGRKLNYNIQNISFNEKNYLMNTYKCFKIYEYPKTELAILELDYILQDEKIFNKYVKKEIKQIKSKANYLICWYAIPRTEVKKHEKIKKLMKKYSKDKKIEILDLSFIYNEKYSEMCTHSKNFINDTGNIMIYKKLEEAIKKIE